MRIERTNSNMNFGAKYISTAQIREKIPFTPFYKKIDVDFVELEQQHDIPALREYASDRFNKFGLDILCDLMQIYDDKPLKIFALTRQRTNHKTLLANKIVGLCDGFENIDSNGNKNFFIYYLETKSKNNKSRPLTKGFINILGIRIKYAQKSAGEGRAILRQLINNYRGKLNSIELEALPEARSFYKHLGFQANKENSCYFCLSRNEFNQV